MNKIYDVIIVGSGIAGLSAAMYCGRFNLKTLVLGILPGGIIVTTDLVENYPGILSISGPDMGMTFLEHAKKFGARIQHEEVIEVNKTDGVFTAKTNTGSYQGKTLIFATGTSHKKLGVPGEDDFLGKGVSYCALCDGAFFKNKTVCVVGGGDSAAIEALILSKHAAKIYMFVRRDVLRAEPVNYEKIKASPNIEIKFKTEIAEVLGKDKVEKVKLKSGEELQLDGVFVAIGIIPLSNLAKSLGVETDESGFIKVNVNCETNVAGVFAAGDVTNKPFKQAIIGASEGVMAAYFAYQFVSRPSLGVKP